MSEQPTINFSAIPNRRSYSCYNCNHSFYITHVTTTDSTSPPPSSFRCPRCFQCHLIPFYTVVPPPPPPPPPPAQNTIPVPPVFAYNYYYFDDEDEDDEDYDSEDDENDDDYDYYAELVFAIPTNYNVSPFAIRSFVNKLPVVKEFPNPNSSCSICMEEFGVKVGGGRVVVELPCKHCFDKGCIGEWLKRSNSCPMCRIKLRLGGHNGVLERRVEVVEPPVLRRVNAESSLSAMAEAGGTVLSTNGGERSMHDEDGDTLMADAD